jgi:hypothetical protein
MSGSITRQGSDTVELLMLKYGDASNLGWTLDSNLSGGGGRVHVRFFFCNIEEQNRFSELSDTFFSELSFDCKLLKYF